VRDGQARPVDCLRVVPELIRSEAGHHASSAMPAWRARPSAQRSIASRKRRSSHRHSAAR
jgi:hypothetical protein